MYVVFINKFLRVIWNKICLMPAKLDKTVSCMWLKLNLIWSFSVKSMGGIAVFFYMGKWVVLCIERLI